MFALFLIHLLRLMILLFGVPSLDQHIGGCLILVDSGDFEYDIINLEDLSVVINNDLLCLFLKFFLLFNIVLIEVYS